MNCFAVVVRAMKEWTEPFDRCLQPEIYRYRMDSLHRNCEMEPRASDCEDPQGGVFTKMAGIKGGGWSS